jgi:hypothetical protein
MEKLTELSYNELFSLKMSIGEELQKRNNDLGSIKDYLEENVPCEIKEIKFWNGSNNQHIGNRFYIELNNGYLLDLRRPFGNVYDDLVEIVRIYQENQESNGA